MDHDRLPTTRRSIIDALSSVDLAERTRAFDTLVALYWRPLYKYARVGRGKSREDAEDLTQSFFTRAFERASLAAFDASRASFRGFLRMLFDRHAANEWKASVREKRGGDATLLDFATIEEELAREHDRHGSPEEYLEREWVRSVFTVAIDRLRGWALAAQKDAAFAMFEAYDLDDAPTPSYRELAQRFGVAETTVTNQLAAVRRQFRVIVLDLLREVTASEQEFRREARALLGVEP